MTRINSLEALLEDQLRDIFNAETQLLKALPKMANRASSEALREAFESHREETEGQLERLEIIASRLGIKLTGKKCRAMEGLIEEGGEMLSAAGEEKIIDLGLIGAAQRIEHYEISAYGTARALAEQLGEEEVVELLQKNLEEEAAADERLTAISEEEILPGLEPEIGAGDESFDDESDLEGTRRSRGRNPRRLAIQEEEDLVNDGDEEDLSAERESDYDLGDEYGYDYDGDRSYSGDYGDDDRGGPRRGRH